MCRQTHSTKHPTKPLRNPCQTQPADGSWSTFWLIYTTAPLLFTLEPLESRLRYRCLLPDLLHTAGRSSTSSPELNNSTLRFHVRTTRFRLSSVLVCNVCLPDVVFWFGAHSRNNAVTCKNRKLTKNYPLPWTCPVQSSHGTAAVTQQHYFSRILRGSQVKCSLSSTTELWINNFSSIKRLLFQTWSGLHLEILIRRAQRAVLLLTCHPAPWFQGSPHCTNLTSREESRPGEQAV